MLKEMIFESLTEKTLLGLVSPFHATEWKKEMIREELVARGSSLSA